MKMVAGVLLLSMTSFPALEAAPRDRSTRLWLTDLRTEGYVVEKFAAPDAYQVNRQIAFGSIHELLVTNDPHLNPLTIGSVTGFVLDAATGHILNRASWQAEYDRYVFATASGNYVVNTAHGLVLYSAGLAEPKLTVSASAMYASPDGVSFASKRVIPGPHGSTYFLDPDTLQPNGTDYLDKNVDSIARDRIAYSAIVNNVHAVIVQQPSGTVSTYLTRCPEPRATFLSLDVLAISGCDRVEVIDTFKGLRFSTRTEAYDTSVVGISRDGRRFTIREAFFGRGDDPGLKFERFTVMDIPSKSPLLTVTIKELHGRRYGASAAALTPNGSLLAVDSQGLVQLFRVGPSETMP